MKHLPVLFFILFSINLNAFAEPLRDTIPKKEFIFGFQISYVAGANKYASNEYSLFSEYRINNRFSIDGDLGLSFERENRLFFGEATRISRYLSLDLNAKYYIDTWNKFYLKGGFHKNFGGLYQGIQGQFGAGFNTLVGKNRIFSTELNFRYNGSFPLGGGSLKLSF